MGAIPNSPLVSQPQDEKKNHLDGPSLPSSDGYLEIDEPHLSSSENDAELDEALQHLSKDRLTIDKELQKLEEINEDREATDRLLQEYFKQKKLAGEDERSLIFAPELLPLLQFLLRKHKYIQDNIPPSPPLQEKISIWQTLFQIGKKLTDMTDDVWSTLRGAISQNTIDLVSPILVGITGFILLAIEGYLGGIDAYKAYKNEKIGQRKTRIALGATAFMLGGGGVGLSAAYLASAAGGVVLGSAFFPVVITALLVAIYGLALWKRAYSLHRAKRDEVQSRIEYETFFNENNEKIKALKAELSINERNLQQLKIISIDKLLSKEMVDEKAVTESVDRISALEQQLAGLQNQMSEKEQLYQDARTARLSAERELAFSTIEVFASTLVLVGTILTATAIFSVASIASFGALPLAILIAGVATGFLSKLFEYKDEKKNHAYTARIRNWFVGDSEKLTYKPTDVPSVKPVSAVALSTQGPKTSASSPSAAASLATVGVFSVKNMAEIKTPANDSTMQDESDDESAPLIPKSPRK